MTTLKERKKLEQLATIITGIPPITDYEYVALSYSKPRKGLIKQNKTNYFKSNKRII